MAGTSISGAEAIGLLWIVILAFLRLTTRSGLFQKPLSVQDAFDLIEAWTLQSSVVIPEPGPHHLRTMRNMVAGIGIGGNLTSDAYLAALAIEYDAELCSTDSDFARFKNLRWRNPLADSAG